MKLEELIEKYGEKKAAKTVFKYWKSGRTLDQLAAMFETTRTKIWELLKKWYPFLRHYSFI
ncbi:MAG: hypothetical protein DRJ03_08100 [Chloroflexi bacterium]|nr:MAG: hypothetical protein DRJ03_08100 [Chloroflexota bacterium]